ncbi:hypothetical protein DPSP01_006318 [Paraphaeosphaeria sporulosa]
MVLTPVFSGMNVLVVSVACLILLLIIASLSVINTLVLVRRSSRRHGPDSFRDACELLPKLFPPSTIFMPNGIVVKQSAFINTRMIGPDSFAANATPTMNKTASQFISLLLRRRNVGE